MDPIFVTVMAVAIALLLIYVALCFSVFRFAFRRNKKQGRANMEASLVQMGEYRDDVAAAIAWVDALSYEELCICSYDGLLLHARLYGKEDAPATVLLFHGYRSYGERDFGGIFPFYLEERGYRVLLVDQRAHGKSEGNYITFGICERHDCVFWANYLANRYGASHKLVLDGMSMGAATVMMASAEHLPQNVVGVVADCGYSSPVGILRHVGTHMHLPLPLILPAVSWLCRLVAHFNLYETTAVAAMAASSLPKLLVHGQADDFVPYMMGEEIFAAAEGEKVLVSVDGAGHGMSYPTSPLQVLKALSAFLDTYVGK